MKPITCRSLGLLVATTLGTSLFGQTSVISATGWTSSTTAPGGSGTLSGQTVAAATVTVPYNTLSGNANPSNVYFSSGIPAQYNTTTFGGDLWISFSGGRTTGTGSANFKLSQGSDADSGMALRIGSIDGSTNWSVSGGSASDTTGVTNTGVSMNTGDKISFVLIHIAYGSNTTDTASVWIFDSKSSAPTLSTSLGAATATLTGDFAFDRLGLYAASNSTFAFDTITLANSFATAVPEPSSYALALGLGTLALVAYRRYRARRR